jgi:hypothetical protein
VTDPVIVLRKLVTLRDYLERARTRCPETLERDTLLQDGLAMALLVTGDVRRAVVAGGSTETT